MFVAFKGVISDRFHRVGKDDRREGTACKRISADAFQLLGTGEILDRRTASESGTHNFRNAVVKDDRFQRSALIEHTACDHRYGRWDRDRFQFVTALEDFRLHRRDGIGNADVFQISAVTECALADEADMLGNREACECATGKDVRLQASDPARKIDLGKLFTAKEGSESDFRDGFRDEKRLEFAFGKSVFTDRGDTVAETKLGQIAASEHGIGNFCQARRQRYLGKIGATAENVCAEIRCAFGKMSGSQGRAIFKGSLSD